MTRPLFYLAHPVAGDVTENVARALRWLAWARKTWPHHTVIAPWIASILSGDDDSNPAHRQAGIDDAITVIRYCDGIILCGPRISSGMEIEMRSGLEKSRNFMVFNLTGMLRVEPPQFDLSEPVMGERGPR